MGECNKAVNSSLPQLHLWLPSLFHPHHPLITLITILEHFSTALPARQQFSSWAAIAYPRNDCLDLAPGTSVTGSLDEAGTYSFSGRGPGTPLDFIGAPVSGCRTL